MWQGVGCWSDIRRGRLLAFNLSKSKHHFWHSCKNSGTINGILQCGLGGQKLYNGEKKTFWVKWGLNADPFQSFCGLISRYSHQNSTRSLKSAYLRHFTFCDKSACVHYGRTGVYNDDHQSFHPILPCVSLSSCLFVTFNCAVQVSKHYNGENETFCVKCGLMRPSPQLRPFMVPLQK